MAFSYIIVNKCITKKGVQKLDIVHEAYSGN